MTTHPSTEIIRLLREQLEAQKARHSRYTLRRFAQKLGVPAPIVSQVLSGKRNLTPRLAAQLLGSLDVDSARKHELVESLARVRGDKTRPSVGRLLKHVELSASEFQIVADWWHFAILALVDSGYSDADPERLARKFSITAPKARAALANLERAGMIAIEKGRVKSTGKSFTTTADLPSTLIQSNHRAGLDLAREAITAYTPAQRDFSSMTVACDPALLPELKKRIEKFRRGLTDFMEESKGQTVYRLQLQLFPVSQGEEK